MAKENEKLPISDKELVVPKKLANYFAYYPTTDRLFGNECELGIFCHFTLLDAQNHAKKTNGVAFEELR